MKAKTRRIAYLSVGGIVFLGILAFATIAANAQSNNLGLLLGRGAQHQKDNGELTGEYIDFKFTKQGSHDDPSEFINDFFRSALPNQFNEQSKLLDRKKVE